MKFKLIADSCTISFEKRINDLLSEGWQLKGDIFICKDDEENDFMCQVMILPQEVKPTLTLEAGKCYKTRKGSVLFVDFISLKADELYPVYAKVIHNKDGEFGGKKNQTFTINGIYIVGSQFVKLIEEYKFN